MSSTIAGAAPVTARASASKNCCRCQYSARGAGRGRSGCSTRSSETNRATSVRQSGSRRASDSRTGSLRSHPVTGENASRPSGGVRARPRHGDALCVGPLEHLLSEAALAESGLPGDERQDGGARLHPVPGPEELVPFCRAAHERRQRIARAAGLAGGHGSIRRARRCGARGACARRESRRRAPRRARAEASRRRSSRREGGRMIPVERVDAHQAQVGLVLERIEAQEVLRVRHRGRMVVLLLGETDGQIERAERAGAQSIAMGTSTRRNSPAAGHPRNLRDAGEPGAGGGALPWRSWRGPLRTRARTRRRRLRARPARHCIARASDVDPVLVIRPPWRSWWSELPQVVPACASRRRARSGPPSAAATGARRNGSRGTQSARAAVRRPARRVPGDLSANPPRSWRCKVTFMSRAGCARGGPTIPAKAHPAKWPGQKRRAATLPRDVGRDGAAVVNARFVSTRKFEPVVWRSAWNSSRCRPCPA